MCYLTADDVLRINQRLLGHARLRDFGLLEAAMLRPQTAVGGEDAYRDLSSKAAAMFHSLVRNHPFLDGNKGHRRGRDDGDARSQRRPAVSSRTETSTSLRW